jgi:hypothetical protein
VSTQAQSASVEVQSAADKQSSKRHPLWILLGLSFAAIVPFWTVHYPVMADYPNHLARWFVLFHMNDTAYHFSQFYAAAWQPLPYIAPDVLAVALQHLMPIEFAGKCVLSLGVILVTLSSYYLLKVACPENIELAGLSILVALNPNFLMGSISNEYSLGFCLIAVALWVQYCKTPKAVTGALVTLMLVIVYLSHLIGFFVAGLTMGVYALFQKDKWKRLAVLALFSVPGLLLYFSHPIHAGGGAAFVYAHLTPWIKIKELAFPIRLYVWHNLDFLLLALLGLLLSLLLKDRPLTTLQPVWLAIWLVMLVAYFAAPSDFGLAGAYMDVRLLPFAYLFLLAVVRFGRIPRYVYVGLALVVLLRIATVEQLFVSGQAELAGLTSSFEAIPRDARVLPLVPLPEKGIFGRGDVHHFEYGVIDRGFLDPVVFHLDGIQPIRLQGSPYCPNIYCDSANAGATEVDWDGIARSYDYLWLYGDAKQVPSSAAIGDAVFTSSDVRIFRIRRVQHE